MIKAPVVHPTPQSPSPSRSMTVPDEKTLNGTLKGTPKGTLQSNPMQTLQHRIEALRGHIITLKEPLRAAFAEPLKEPSKEPITIKEHLKEYLQELLK